MKASLLATNSGLKGEVINVGTGIATSFNTIVELLNRELGTAIEPTYVPNPIKNVKHTQADTTKAQRLLNFRAKTPLIEGVLILVPFPCSCRHVIPFSTPTFNTASPFRHGV